MTQIQPDPVENCRYLDKSGDRMPAFWVPEDVPMFYRTERPGSLGEALKLDISAGHVPEETP